MILAQLTATKSNLAVSDPCLVASGGPNQKNDNIFLNGSSVELSGFAGATAYFDGADGSVPDGKVTIQEVVRKVESKWTGTLLTSYPRNYNRGFRSFSPLTDDQIIAILAGINEGTLIFGQGNGPTNSADHRAVTQEAGPLGPASCACRSHPLTSKVVPASRPARLGI